MSLNLATKAILLLSVPLFSTSYPQHACASTIDLPSDVASLIPACVTGCLSAFVNENFANSSCGDQPTLQCLCAHTGENGYTVGEGALACVAIEDRSGCCNGENATASVSTRAYDLCSGQISAAAETHSTLIATLVVQTTATAPTSSASSQSTLSRSSTARETAATLITASSMEPVTASPTTLITASPTTVTTASTAAAQTTGMPTSSHKESLSTAAIIGISIGATAGFVLLAGLYLLARRTRRRRLEGTEPPVDISFREAREATGFKRRRESHPHELEISLPLNLDPRGLGLAGQIPVRRDSGRFENVRRPPAPTHDAALPESGLSPTPAAVFPQTNQPPEASSSRPQPAPQPWRVAASSQPPAMAVSLESTNTRNQYQQPLPLPQRALPPAQERESVITEFAEDGEPESAIDQMPVRRSELFWPHQSSAHTRSVVSGMLDGYGSGWTSEDRVQSRRADAANGRRAVPGYASSNLAGSSSIQNPFSNADRYQSRPAIQPQANLERSRNNVYNSQNMPMQYPSAYYNRQRPVMVPTGAYRQPEDPRTRWQQADEPSMAERNPAGFHNSPLVNMAPWPSPAPVPPLKVPRRASQQIRR